MVYICFFDKEDVQTRTYDQCAFKISKHYIFMLCIIFYFYPKVYCREVGFIPSHSMRWCWSRCIETAKCKCHKLENRRKLSFFQLFGIFCGQSELEYKTSFLLKLLIYLRLWAERRREAWEGVWRPSWSRSCEFSSGNVFNGKKIQISFSLSHILFLIQTFPYLQTANLWAILCKYI